MRDIYLSLTALLFSLFIIQSCSKERLKLIGHSDTYNPRRAFILLNEFMAKESVTPNVNELGEPGDWIELYNPGNDTLHLKHGEWFITDNESRKGKYPLPDAIMPPLSYLLIWCDKNDMVPGLHGIHTNFNLSSGEDIGLYFTAGHDTLEYDVRTFGPQSSDISEGRDPDRPDQWTTFTEPTPGKQNKSFSNYR